MLRNRVDREARREAAGGSAARRHDPAPIGGYPAAMFRRPTRRLTLRDLIRARVRRLLIVGPLYAGLLLSGALDPVREPLVARLNAELTLLAAHLPKAGAAERPRAVAEAERGCAPVTRGTAGGIVFHRAEGCAPN